MGGFLIFTLLLLIILFCLYVRKKLLNRHLEKLASEIPGPTPYPIVGNASLFTTSKDPAIVMLDLIQQYGDVSRVWLGSYVFVTLIDPKDVEAILSGSKHLLKAFDYEFIRPWLGNGLITANGNAWQHHRKLLTPTFHFKILEQSLSVIYNYSLCLVEQLKKELYGPEFDIYNYFQKCSIDILCETAMGIKLNTLESGNTTYMDACKTVTNISVRRSFEVFLHPEILFRMSGLYSTFKTSVDIMHNTSRNVILERKQELSEKIGKGINEEHEKRKTMPFLDMLLLESGFTDDELHDEVKSFMFAGHDTTTAALSFITRQLALHQDVQDKVYEEIQDILPPDGTCPTIQDLNNLKYLDLVIKESMRLYPPVPMIEREICEDVKLPSGYILPRGSQINIFIYGIHRNSKIYENPLEFIPERFANDNKDRSPYAYIPFSAGSRNCIGQKYAMLEIKIMLCAILRKYRILATDRTSTIRIETKLILRSLDGIPVMLLPRV